MWADIARTGDAEPMMNRMDHHCPFTDACGDPLDRACAAVTHREDSGNARRQARGRRRPSIIGAIGLDESVIIECHGSGKPILFGTAPIIGNMFEAGRCTSLPSNRRQHTASSEILPMSDVTSQRGCSEMLGES